MFCNAATAGQQLQQKLLYMEKVSQKGALEKTNLREEVQEKTNRNISKVNMNEIIKLNVGGKLYETRRQTLLADQGSMLAKMFSGEYLFSGEYQDSRESDGSYFIDRDGKHFRLILNYLRNGVLPDEVLSEFGSELYPEAVFYGLTGLMQQMTSQKGNQIPVAKPVGLSSAALPVKYPERDVLPGQFRFLFAGGKIVETSIFTLQVGLPVFWRMIQDHSSTRVFYLDTIEPEILEIILENVKTGAIIPVESHSRASSNAMRKALRHAASIFSKPAIKDLLPCSYGGEPVRLSGWPAK